MKEYFIFQKRNITNPHAWQCEWTWKSYHVNSKPAGQDQFLGNVHTDVYQLCHKKIIFN